VYLQEQRDIEERAAERQAEREAAQDDHAVPHTTADIVRAALAGGQGTINGEEA
jgi:hypothetical protein